jgi:uncharacterized OB-fold protein
MTIFNEHRFSGDLSNCCQQHLRERFMALEANDKLHFTRCEVCGRGMTMQRGVWRYSETPEITDVDVRWHQEEPGGNGHQDPHE